MSSILISLVVSSASFQFGKELELCLNEINSICMVCGLLKVYQMYLTFMKARIA